MVLSARKAQTAKRGKYGDGRGCMLLLKYNGSRSWVFRYQIQGRRRDMGSGPEISLARAREKAHDARRLLAVGKESLATRVTEKSMTFADCAQELVESKKSVGKTQNTPNNIKTP